MGKTKQIKLPKYLKLAKGMMWFDTDGANSSGVRLIACDQQFVGRGCHTDDEWEHYLKEGYIDAKPVPEDSNRNLSTEDGAYGSVKMKEDRSFFCTTDIPKEKLGRILTAYQNGILVKYDPKKDVPTEDKKEVFPENKNKDFTIKHDGDIVFIGKNQEMFNKLQTYEWKALQRFIDKSTFSSRANLQDMLEYEMKGYNLLSRPRQEVVDAIRNKLNTLGGGISPIRVGDED